MSNYTSDLLRLLNERGYIHQVTDAEGLDALAAKQIVPGYIGFDATAPSLHIGSLVQIMMLRRLQQTGHKPIVLMGGGTTRIGDPTGRDESRKMLTDATIDENIAGIRTVFERLLTFGDGPTDAVMVNNQDWLGGLGYIEMLQKVGTHFTVNRMLSFDSVRLRLEREQPMTFLEFNYMILQGYDFRYLSQEMGARLQMGGSDQWGNIVNGMELGRRMDGSELFGLTTPLLTTADGAKMGKTAAGAVWLNEAQLPSYDFWQYWRNVDDRDVGRFLRLFTDLDLGEIARLERTAAETFAGGGAGADLPTLDVGADGMRIGAVLTALGFTASNGEAKRKLTEGAVRLDGEAVADPAYLVTIAEGAESKLSLGKKKHAIIRR